MPAQKKYGNPMTEQVLVRMTPEQHAALKIYAEKRNVELATAMRIALNAAVQNVVTGSDLVVLNMKTGEAQGIPATPIPDGTYKVDEANVKTVYLVTERKKEDDPD